MLDIAFSTMLSARLFVSLIPAEHAKKITSQKPPTFYLRV